MKTLDELRAKGWYFQFTGDSEGWDCFTVGTGLAYGHGRGETLSKAAEQALQQARAMEDNPKVLIGRYGPRIEALAKEIFGEKAYQGLEPVESPEPGMPRRIAISIVPKVDFQKYHKQSFSFTRRIVEDFPKEVAASFIVEEDWPVEKAKG